MYDFCVTKFRLIVEKVMIFSKILSTSTSTFEVEVEVDTIWGKNQKFFTDSS